MVPQIDTFLDNGFTKEEMKMVNETNKILDPNISINATCVRVASEIGHAESVYIELEKNINIELIKSALKKQKKKLFFQMMTTILQLIVQEMMGYMFQD